jgi:hypothetical protein
MKYNHRISLATIMETDRIQGPDRGALTVMEVRQ